MANLLRPIYEERTEEPNAAFALALLTEMYVCSLHV